MTAANNNKFSCISRKLSGSAIELSFERNGISCSNIDVYGLLQESTVFRTCFIEALANAPFDGFYWECAPLTVVERNAEFECVVLDAPGLIRKADFRPFSARFMACNPDCQVIAFENIGHDALLVVPTPLGPDHWYSHIGQFLRNAQRDQVHALWQRVGEEMGKLEGNHPVWLSTSGAGVSWLHIRLDTFPKYYMHQPYRDRINPAARQE